ncbi:hypothetical protein PVAND_004098 [Polypedilum vanderplanki]|uniref:Regulator of microtubule dynamics protein 1 n=1 Tax=Polypedilum vanderplanki TaxID=319348 RepID=A0A9J6BW07_POLVA|nr:hypothetical protein PVAND_004098 [Polypedilum vanderplanki]
MVDLKSEIAHADKLFDEDKLEETIEYLKNLDQSNVQILWRLARAHYQLAKAVTNKYEKSELIKNGFEYSSESLKVDEKCAEANCFFACLLDAISELHGLRERAMRLKDIKRHIVRSVELNPDFAVGQYALGRFLYEIADLAWYKRKIVEAVFAKPPDASYEEALEHFLMAEKIEPDFYSINKLMTAKSYIALKDYASAKTFLIKAASIKIKNDEDEKCVKEAKLLLTKYN